MFSCIVAEEVSQDALAAAEKLGTGLAEEMKSAGAGAILEAAKKQTAAEIMKQKEEKEAKKAKVEAAKNDEVKVSDVNSEKAS